MVHAQPVVVMLPRSITRVGALLFVIDFRWGAMSDNIFARGRSIRQNAVREYHAPNLDTPPPPTYNPPNPW